MNADFEADDPKTPPSESEQALAEWLASYQAALQSGDADVPPPPADVRAADRARLRRAQACLHLLQQARPGPGNGHGPAAARRAAETKEHRPALSLGEEALLAVILGEIRLRQNLNEPANLTELLKQYPRYAGPIRQRLADLDASLMETPRPEGQTGKQRAAEHRAWPQVPGFDILEEIGRGGMGVVYKAWQVRLKRVVALKMIRTGTLPDAQALQRFRREAETLARLQHPNIVQVFEVGEAASAEHGATIPYFALEYVEGGSLDMKLGGTPLVPAHAAALAETLARAMHVAHQAGVVHRDLKPANVLLLERGVKSEVIGGKTSSILPSSPQSAILSPHCYAPKITDFGLAKQLDAGASQTSTGVIVGTPSYMAPEQARGGPLATVHGAADPVGPAVDVYALGAILYELLTGRPPFKAATSLDTVMLVLHEEPVPPSRLQPGLPRDLESICLKCLEKAPARRYASAADLAEDLRRFQTREPILARATGRLERAWRWCRRKPLAAALILVSLVAGLALPAAVTSALYNVDLSDSLEQTSLARQAEAEARRREQEAAYKAETFHYFHRVALADAEWRETRIARVEQLLGECPEPLRNWEWHYLKRQCRPKILNLVHEAPLYTLAMSADGKLVAAGGEDHAVTIWDSASGQQLHKLLGHTASVHGVRFNRGGDRLITACSDKTVKIWDTATGKELYVLSGHTNGVRAALFDPEGRWLASAGKDGRVLIWDVASQNPRHDLDGGAYHNCCLAVSRDGRKLAYAADKVVKIWDPASGVLLHTFELPKAHVRALDFSHDGARLALATDADVVHLWDVAAAKIALTLKGHTGIVYSVAYSGDGQRIASGSLDATIKVWDAASGKEVGQLAGHTGRVNGIAFAPDRKRLASAAMDRTIKVWDLDGTREAVIATDTRFRSVAWSADGQRLAAAGTPDGIVKVWQADTGKLLLALKTDSALVSHLAFSRDGKWLASAASSGTVQLWDAVSGKPVRALKRSTDKNPSFIAVFSRDSRLLATGHRDKTANIWDVATGRPLVCYQGHQHDVEALAWSPDGRRLTSAGEDQSVKVWDAATGDTVWSEPEKARVTRVVAWSPDGQLVASGNFDGTVHLRDAATGSFVRRLAGHTYAVNGMAWSPDGKRLATCSGDRTILIWQPDSGQQALTLRGHANAIHAVAWSPDGHRLASAGVDGTIRVWDATPLTP